MTTDMAITSGCLASRARLWTKPVAGLFLAVALSAWTSMAFASPDLHLDFHEVLTAHVSEGRVDYPAIAADPRFNAYVEKLAEVSPDQLATREERLAYWINAYNAFAIKGILDGQSPSTFFGRIGYFKTTEYRLGGEYIDLYDLEREVIIPQGEPRIHFAINCASASCPILRSEVYTAEQLEPQLEASTKAFINDTTRNRFDREAKVAHLSKIFDWFTDDFSNDAGTVLEYVARYVDDPDLASELRDGGYTIKFLEYDWSLNGTPPTS